MKKLCYFTLIVILPVLSFAQNKYSIVLISDNVQSDSNFFEEQVVQEIEALFASKFDVDVEVKYSNNDFTQIAANIQEAFNDPSVQIVLGAGLSTCGVLAIQESYPKPVILTTIIDVDLQNIPITPEGTSGTKNLTYIQSPFDIERDFKTLYDIRPFKKVLILGDSGMTQIDDDVRRYFDSVIAPLGADFDIIPVLNGGDGIPGLLTEENGFDAVFLLPLFNELSNDQIKSLFDTFAEKKMTTFSLLNSPDMELGGYAAFDTDNNTQRIPRRAAIDALKIAEGMAAEDIEVKMDNFTETLLISLKAAKRIQHFPNWETLSKAVLIDVAEENANAERILSLRSAIAEGLLNNLDLEVARKETQLSEKDVAIAKGNYLPQIDASSALATIYQDTTVFGQRIEEIFSWSATGSMTQLILSEPAIANIAIQKMLLESQKESQRESELDLVLNVANGYLGILQATAIVKLSNENLNVTRANYNIAKAKEQVGYGGINDVYRFESELALDNVDLNNSLAQLRQANYNLNVVLNRPVKEAFRLEDVELADSILLALDSRLFPLINNPGDLELFSDFLVEEAFRNLPELRQIELAISAQERNLKSQNRAFYLPTIAFSGQYEYPINSYINPDRIDITEPPTFTTAFSAQIPIFQGMIRKNQRDQSKVSVLQLEDQKANLNNLLEFQVRANLQVAGASFNNLELSRSAAEAARKNFEIAQDSYQEGLLNITSLIDAQNAFFQAETNAINAEYTFIQDFLAVERSMGYYHFLATPEAQTSFFQRFMQFIINK